MSNSGVIRKIFVVFAGSALTRAVSFATMLLLVRSFDPANFALFAIVDTVIGFAAGVVTSGVNWWMIRFVSQNGIENSEQVVRRAFLIQISYAVVAAGIVLLSSSFIADSIFRKPETRVYVQIAAMGIFGNVLFFFRSALYQSAKRFRYDAQFNVISAVLFLASVFVYLHIINGHSMIPVCIAHVLVPAIVSGVALVLSGPLFRAKISFGKTDRRLLFTSGLSGVKWLLTYSLALWFTGQVHMIVMTSFRPLDEVGVYALAMKIYLISMMLTNSINAVLLPQLSSMKTRSDLKLELKKTFSITFWIAILILAVIPFLDFLLVAVAGESYRPAVPPLRVLLVGTALSAVFSPPVNALFALGKYRELATGGIGLTAIGLLLHLVFTARYGSMAAAIVLVSTYFLMNLYLSSIAVVSLMRDTSPPDGDLEQGLKGQDLIKTEFPV
jgi:O-antigen/teichoic acid export membrane protein